MYDQLKPRLASLLSRPRPLKPQTERQLATHLAEHSASLSSFLLCAADVLEDYELDIVFGPLFTPTLDERIGVAELLFHWRPSPEQLQQLVKELCDEMRDVPVLLPDGTQAKLALHEVMVERYLKLLRLDSAPDAATAAALREALPAELWPVAIALLCERGMTRRHQQWFAAFVNHICGKRAMSRGLLETIAGFIASQQNLDRAALSTAADALMRATEGTAAYAAGGHAYWSPDVAQHHHYRGEGKIDEQRLRQNQVEVENLAALVKDLLTFEFSATESC